MAAPVKSQTLARVWLDVRFSAKADIVESPLSVPPVIRIDRTRVSLKPLFSGLRFIFRRRIPPLLLWWLLFGIAPIVPIPPSHICKHLSKMVT